MGQAAANLPDARRVRGTVVERVDHMLMHYDAEVLPRAKKKESNSGREGSSRPGTIISGGEISASR